MVNPNSPTPQGPRRPVAVLGTLLPHLHPERHYVYRDVTGLALLAALIAAAFGSLPVALVLTAVALPAAVLVYIHDHRLWHDEPITVIVVAFGLSLLLGVAVGLLETHFIPLAAAGSIHYQLPPVPRILELGLLVPVAAFVAVLIGPLVISGRPSFRHPLDVVVAGSLSGAALSLGLSVVVQHGAFTHVQVTAGDPAHVAFIALTLGFLQPIVLATAATVGVLGLRRLGVSPVLGVIEGLVLVVAYELATTVLHPYGTRGIVLTALAAFVLAAAGLVAARNALHAALLADTGADAQGAEAPDVEHRLHAGLVTAIVTVVVVIAAVVSVAVALSGPSTRPAPPGEGGIGRIAPHSAAAARSIRPGVGKLDQSPWGRVALASTTTSLAAGAAATINLTHGINMTVAPGWTVTDQGQQSADLLNRDQSAALFVVVGGVDTSDIGQESTSLINQNIQSSGLTNVKQRSAPPQPLQGNNFQQMLEVDYTANVQTAQGTDQIYGGWVTLYNSVTGGSGFFNIYAGSRDAFTAALPDAATMMVSME
ncbi:zinc ribbon domain-containing protein [Mycobacterium sp.]|uniref:zinc ribbon domain-containing protein n=1 Tax=Mycobacterium sp. TaxID=1785 RepID=UPI003BB10998